MHNEEFSSDLAIEDNGTMLILLSRKTEDSGYSLTRCTYRGEPLEKIKNSNFPPEFSGQFSPCSLSSRNGRIYLVDKEGMKAVVTDAKGRFLAGYYITSDDIEDGRASSIESYQIDDEGAISFTLSCCSQSRAIVISAEGTEKPTVTGNRPSVSNITYTLISIVGLIVTCQAITGC